MFKTKGFTLVELLVVIAIIALLMSILMPALALVRKQAKAVICQTNLKQWSAIFSMYTNDHDGYFFEGSYGTIGIEERLKQWMDATRSYYQEPKIRLCPTAMKFEFMGGVYTGEWGSTKAWGIYIEDTVWCSKGDYGSYGINGWVMNPSEKAVLGWLERDEFWRRTDVRGAGIVPLFLDSQHFDGYPTEHAEPPEIENMPWSGTSYADEMDRFCLNRHEGAINGLFLDMSVRKVGLKELWKLKWCRSFDLNAPSPLWPEWMEDL